MAQTRRRRRTKHRGNAAGAIEARGRTGRRPTAAERGSTSRPGQKSARERRLERLDKPPTWRGALNRALLAAVLMLGISMLLLKNKTQLIYMFPIVFLLYWPLGYYTDLFMYRRRQRQKAVAKQR